jgi:hypothetical protein
MTHMGWTIGAVIIVVAVVAIIVVRSRSTRLARKSGEKMSQVAEETDTAMQAARKLQTDYWSFKADDFARLSAQPIESLTWEQRLRLLHLVCLDLFSQESIRRQLMSEEADSTDAPEGPREELIRKLLAVLTSKNSPYRPRRVAVWQGQAGESDKRKPDLQGVLRNASLTHLGCVEVLRLDGNQQPVELCFVPFDDLRGIGFAGQALFRYAKLFYDDGRPDELVLVPLLYGVSWSTPNSFYQDGTLTRLLCRVLLEADESLYLIGVGHQDFFIDGDGLIQFGLGSVGEFMIALATDDPKFREKCRARGLDPDDVLRSAPGQ